MSRKNTKPNYKNRVFAYLARRPRWQLGSATLALVLCALLIVAILQNQDTQHSLSNGTPRTTSEVERTGTGTNTVAEDTTDQTTEPASPTPQKSTEALSPSSPTAPTPEPAVQRDFRAEILGTSFPGEPNSYGMYYKTGDEKFTLRAENINEGDTTPLSVTVTERSLRCNLQSGPLSQRDTEVSCGDFTGDPTHGTYIIMEVSDGVRSETFRVYWIPGP